MEKKLVVKKDGEFTTINKESFVKDIMDAYNNMCPPSWRKGQFVFNYLNEVADGLSRYIQFKHGIDCFYDDSVIDKFIDKAWDTLTSEQE